MVKAHAYFTHRKRLRLEDGAVAERWRVWWGGHAAALHAAGALACLLWQLPPAFENDARGDNLRRLAAALLSPETSPVAATQRELAAAGERPLRCALEFRHASWQRDTVYAALRAAGWCLVTTVQRNEEPRWAGDLASGTTPPLAAPARGGALQLPVLTCAWGAYVRFHGGQGQYLGRHGDEEMRVWAGRVQALLTARGDGGHDAAEAAHEDRSVFIAFNNTDDASPPSAVADALALARQLRARGVLTADE